MTRAIDICDRRKQLVTYLAGALGGLGLFGAGDLAAGVFLRTPHELAAIFVTTAIVAGGCLGFGYQSFEWEATKLRRDVEDGARKGDDSMDWQPPRKAEVYYRVATLLVGLTGVWLVIAVWWAI